MAVNAIHELHSIHPGEWYFGAAYQRVHTVLGSCVALTAWHPQLKVGGLCHYLLPSAPTQKTAQTNDCRYGNYALAQMKKSMLTFGALDEFQISMFGGGDMFTYHTPHSIGQENIAYARQWVANEKIQLNQSDLGGAISRSLVLLMANGKIQLKRYAMNAHGASE